MLTLRRTQGSALARLGWTLIFMGLVACGDDASDSESQPEAGAGGKVSGGGTGGKGGSGGAGMLPRMMSTMQTDSAYTCRPKAEDKGGIGSDGSRCCAGMGMCTGDLSDGFLHGFPRDTCSADAELRCLPNMRLVQESDVDAGTSAAGFATCRVSFPGAPPEYPDYEGRCLPTCFAKQNPIAARLSQATCAAGELCTPCYDPLTGESTGSCELYGDAPQEAGPQGFPECSDGLGYCVPTFAAGMQASQLMQLTCDEGELCGPKNKVADPGACFAHCDAGSYGPGACVPRFLASFVAGFLEQGECDSGMLCGPCSIFGMRTGICD